METIATMFATFVAFVAGVLFVTEAVNRLFRVQGQTPKLIMSWVVSLVLAALGFWQQIGFFAEIGDITTWQGWVKCALIGWGAGWCANYSYDHNEMWHLLEQIFSLFSKKK